MPLFLANRFKASYEALPREVQARVRAALAELERDPRLGKRLTGPLQGQHSWRVGRCRVLYTIRGGDVFAETVRHRKEAYR